MLSTKELMLSNCGAENSWESLRQQRSNQSILKEINSEYSLEVLMLKLKLQYFGNLMKRADSLEKTLMLGKTESRKRREMVVWHHQLNGHESEQTLRDSEGQGSLECCSSWGCSQTPLSDWTTTTYNIYNIHVVYFILYMCIYNESHHFNNFYV